MNLEEKPQLEGQQHTPQQKIEVWLKRMGDSKAELDIGPGMIVDRSTPETAFKVSFLHISVYLQGVPSDHAPGFG